MAGYDPKRPRPTSDDADPAPVDALLEPEEPAEPIADVREPEVADVREPEVADVREPEVADVREPEVADVREPVVTPEDVKPVPGPLPERHLRPVPDGGSDVPVAERPVEPTANRAIALVGVIGAIAAALVIAAVVMRRRR